MQKRKNHIEIVQNPTKDLLKGILEDARITTINRVHDIPTEELHWQYADGWNTVGALLSHINSASNILRIECIEDRVLTEEENKFYTPGFEMGEYIPQLITDDPIDYYLKELEISQKKLFDVIENLSEEDIAKIHSFDEGENQINLAWLLYHMAEDEVHHRGQISILRKLYKDLHNS